MKVKDHIRRFAESLRKSFHWCRFKTLLIYPPRAGADEYGFLLHCDCGATKLTKLPSNISEVLEVRPYPKSIAGKYDLEA